MDTDEARSLRYNTDDSQDHVRHHGFIYCRLVVINSYMEDTEHATVCHNKNRPHPFKSESWSDGSSIVSMQALLVLTREHFHPALTDHFSSIPRPYFIVWLMIPVEWAWPVLFERCNCLAPRPHPIIVLSARHKTANRNLKCTKQNHFSHFQAQMHEDTKSYFVIVTWYFIIFLE